MKIERFNKIGDTTFRVKNQINAYLSFADWFINTNNRSDAEFRRWTKESGIYDYGNNQINRLKFVLNNALFKFKIIKKIGDVYTWNISLNNYKNDILNNLTNLDGLTKKLDIESCLAFKAMLDFMINHPECTNAERIFKAFAVYEKNDDFYELYNINGLFRIMAKQKIPYGKGLEALNSNLYVKKPSPYLRLVCKRIVEDKKNFKITSVEFEKMKRTYLFSIKKKELFDAFVRESNFDTIAREMFAHSKAELLNVEYFDLFNRVLWGLDLSPAYGFANIREYYNKNVRYINGKYSISNVVSPPFLPYTLEEINHYLRKIQNFEFDFMENDSHLASKPRADIAEYFVNMKFCLIFKINIKDIRKYVNTGLDNELYPTSHAGGGISDMNYETGEKLYGIETTIHRTVNSIIDHELRGSIDHLDTHRSRKKNLVLYLIQVKSSDPKIVRCFTDYANIALTRTGKQFSFYTYNFEQLADFEV